MAPCYNVQNVKRIYLYICTQTYTYMCVYSTRISPGRVPATLPSTCVPFQSYAGGFALLSNKKEINRWRQPAPAPAELRPAHPSCCMVSPACAAWASPTPAPNKSPSSSLRADEPAQRGAGSPRPRGAVSGIAPCPALVPSLWVGMVESSRHGSGSLRR